MTVVDLAVLVWVGLAAFQGAARGLSTQVVSLAGLAAGGVVGSRIAPLFLEEGASSPWLPVAGLVGAAVGAMLFQLVATALVSRVGWFFPTPVRLIDSVGGALFGAVVGLVIVWLLAVVALQQPSLNLRKQVQRSEVLPRLVEAVPPRTVLHALGRFDPLPLIGRIPGRRLPQPDPSVTRSPESRLAARAVVKILGTACGLGLQGSGWVVGPSLVATNAHVIAGERDTRVVVPNGRNLRARPVYVDALNDVALLRVPSLGVMPLRTAPAQEVERPVALLGYPENGPLVSVGGTAGQPQRIVGPDAYGRRPRSRVVVPLRGEIRRGDSGGPAVDRSGRVVTMMFAATRDRRGGLGVPIDFVTRAARGPLRPVSSGPCTD
ncbi:MAG TPA: MarP family serine protease [Gaiellaceae bacterium]|nr:MarP family serine protease [Gaiellaceae bacterium]